MRLKTNKQGFSAIEALLILIVVGILGFTGWFVYHSKQTADKDLAINSSAASKSKTSTMPSPQTHKTIDPAKAQIAEDTAGVIYNLGMLATTSDQAYQVGAVGRYCLSITRDSEKDGSIVVTTDANFFAANSTAYTYDAKTKTATLDASCYNEANAQVVPALKHFIIKYSDGAWSTQNFNDSQSTLN